MLLQGVDARSQITAPMTAARVKEAIAYGAAARELRLYELSGRMGRVRCGYTTPFLRVAMAAHEAKKNYKPFAERDVTEEMAGPFITVACPSTFVGGTGPQAYRVFANVQNIVVTAKDGTGMAIQPISKEPMPEIYQNAFGAKVEAAGILATLPVAAFAQPGAELHVIFDKKVKAGFGGCEDCALEIRLDKAR
jgi:hypothetical protein